MAALNYMYVLLHKYHGGISHYDYTDEITRQWQAQFFHFRNMNDSTVLDLLHFALFTTHAKLLGDSKFTGKYTKHTLENQALRGIQCNSSRK